MLLTIIVATLAGSTLESFILAAAWLDQAEAGEHK